MFVRDIMRHGNMEVREMEINQRVKEKEKIMAKGNG